MTEQRQSLQKLVEANLDKQAKAAIDERKRRTEDARLKLTKMLDSETAYRFCSEAAEFMSRDGIKVLKREASKGQRWAFRLLMDVMKILAQLELIRAAQQGRKDENEAVDIETSWPSDGDKA